MSTRQLPFHPPDRNKTATTHRVTRAAAQWLSTHGFKLVEREVGVALGWQADLAGTVELTQTEAVNLKLVPRPPRYPIGLHIPQSDPRMIRYHELREECNKRTGLLMRRARHLETYGVAYSYTTHEADERLQATLKNPITRIRLADEISRLLKRELDDVAIYAGLNRAYKKLNTPIVNPVTARQIHDDLVPRLKPTWLLNIYVFEPTTQESGLIKEYVEAFILKHQPATM